MTGATWGAESSWILSTFVPTVATTGVGVMNVWVFDVDAEMIDGSGNTGLTTAATELAELAIGNVESVTRTLELKIGFTDGSCATVGCVLSFWIRSFFDRAADFGRLAMILTIGSLLTSGTGVTCAGLTISMSSSVTTSGVIVGSDCGETGI